MFCWHLFLHNIHIAIDIILVLNDGEVKHTFYKSHFVAASMCILECVSVFRSVAISEIQTGKHTSNTPAEFSANGTVAGPTPQVRL